MPTHLHLWRRQRGEESARSGPRARSSAPRLAPPASHLLSDQAGGDHPSPALHQPSDQCGARPSHATCLQAFQARLHHSSHRAVPLCVGRIGSSLAPGVLVHLLISAASAHRAPHPCALRSISPSPARGR
ncbi:hypothetical protein NDU88_001818 [Pleurodeles waltl]|uniref:Uncharacterized protein n=1 Tax=Pleurodeles waltl TaxID=8319 RepID=A0AAV7TJE5_PLEWA|nr:hypothetical protein NDU88_001818 [Pleurodeles waltl]